MLHCKNKVIYSVQFPMIVQIIYLHPWGKIKRVLERSWDCLFASVLEVMGGAEWWHIDCTIILLHLLGLFYKCGSETKKQLIKWSTAYKYIDCIPNHSKKNDFVGNIDS